MGVTIATRLPLILFVSTIVFSPLFLVMRRCSGVKTINPAF
jgi:hypothetical protein